MRTFALLGLVVFAVLLSPLEFCGISTARGELLGPRHAWRGRGCIASTSCMAAVGCAASVGCVACTPVEQTIMVPQIVMESRTVERTCYRTEQRRHETTRTKTIATPRTVTESHWVIVPETRTREAVYHVTRPVYETKTREVTIQVPQQVTREATRMVLHAYNATETRTAMVAEARTKDVPYTVYTPVTRTRTVEYTVSVPHQEIRHATRRVCTWVNETRIRTVECDEGHWECVPCCPLGFYSAGDGVETAAAANGKSTEETASPFRTVGFRHRAARAGCRWRSIGCASENCTPLSSVDCSWVAPVLMQRVWVPQIVTKEIPYTACVPQFHDEPYSYTVTVPHTETRTREETYVERIPEQRTKQVTQAVLVPRPKTVSVLKTKRVPEPYTFTETVYRPETRTETYQDVQYVSEPRTRIETYTEHVPQERITTRQVTDYQTVEEPWTRIEEVQVPYTVQEVVQVPVCRLVPKTVTCYGPAPCGSPGCAACK